MKKFNKILIVLLCLFLPVSFLVGCDTHSKDPALKSDYEKIYTEFVPVKSIFYNYVPGVSNNLDTERLYSKVTLTLSSRENIIEIEEEEYNSSSLKYEASPYWDSTQELFISKTKNILSQPLDKFKEGEFIAFYSETYAPHYFKRKIISFEINFIYVKILSENTILIKNNDGVQLVTTQQFNLEFFKTSSN